MQPPANYPYGAAPLVPAWRARKAQGLAVFAVLAVVLALWLRAPFGLAALDDVVLRIVLPGGLAFVLAFAPRPATRANRIAKDLIVIWLALAVFAGDRVPLMIVAVTGLLAVSVVLASTRAGVTLWGEGP